MADTNAKVKGFFLYFDQYESIKLLSNEQKGMLLEAMFKKFSGAECEISDPVVAMAFSFMDRGFQIEKDKYMQICEKRKENAKKRWNANASDEMQIDANDASAYSDDAKNANACNCISEDANACKGMQTMPYPDPDPDPDPDSIFIMGSQAPKQTKKNFVPPTVEEVRAYCDERKNGIDAVRFVNFYAARGWMMGKSKMKSWKHAVASWEQNNKQAPQIQNSSYQQSNLSDIVGW